jgi:hypothetical protein
MRHFFHWAMVAVLVPMGIWSLEVYADAFRADIGYFLFLWLFLPILALWLGTKRVRSPFTISQLEMTRNVLTAVAVAISIGSAASYDRIRDSVGHEFVSGYYVTHFEDIDNGVQYLATEIHAAHWYLRLGLWLFGAIFLAVCLCLPALTWIFCELSMKEAIQERDALPELRKTEDDEGINESNSKC